MLQNGSVFDLSKYLRYLDYKRVFWGTTDSVYSYINNADINKV